MLFVLSTEQSLLGTKYTYREGHQEKASNDVKLHHFHFLRCFMRPMTGRSAVLFRKYRDIYNSGKEMRPDVGQFVVDAEERETASPNVPKFFSVASLD